MATRLVVVSVVLVVLAWSSVAHAQIIMVENTNNDGPGSLRAAIAEAAEASGSTVAINVTGTIVVATPLPAVNVAMTITGPGASQLTIQGSAQAAPVFTFGGTVQLSGVTITGAASSGNGGGILVTGGALTLLDSALSANSAMAGSAIHSTGTLTVRRTTVSGNTGPASTGASVIHAGGDTTVIDSTIADSTGTAIVFAAPGRSLTINRSTLSGNTDTTGVGGLHLQAGTANVRNTTFSGNAGAQASAIATTAGSTLSLINVTIAGAGDPALAVAGSSTVSLRNTLLAGTGARCAGQPTSAGHNLSTDATCNLSAAGDKPGVDPMLAPLALTAGTTRTHALLASSPALNAGDGAQLETLDQRGKPRVQFGVVDIGAVEVSEPMITLQPEPKSITEGNSFILTVSANNQNSETELAYQWRKDGAPIAGATTTAYSKASAQLSDAGMYDVLVINDGGSLPSAAVAVTVMAAIGGDVDSGSGDGGGCCSASAGPASSALLALGLLLVLRIPRSRSRR